MRVSSLQFTVIDENEAQILIAAPFWKHLESKKQEKYVRHSAYKNG